VPFERYDEEFEGRGGATSGRTWERRLTLKGMMFARGEFVCMMDADGASSIQEMLKMQKVWVAISLPSVVRWCRATSRL
jgi:hypothetical protein